MDIHLDSNDLINIGVSVLTSTVICIYGYCMLKHCKKNNENILSNNDSVNNIELTNISIENEINKELEDHIIKANDVPLWAKREFIRDKIGKKKVFT